MGRSFTPLRGPHRRSVARGLAALAAVALSLALPAAVLAHPLGNFTINHYAGLTIARDGVDIDVVIDKAEIPAFQDRQTADTDQDGSVSDDEAAAWATSSCSDLLPTLRLAVDGQRVAAAMASHGVSFPPGAGGLSTLRLECTFHATFAAPIDHASTLTFQDGSFAERIGWREIVAAGNGTILDTNGLPATSPSARLTAYPADMIAQPLDIRAATISVRPGGPAATAARGSTSAVASPPAPRPVDVASVAAVPGGVGGELPDIFRTRDVTPLVALLSIGTAIALGAGHALTPGHGKTLMAAYLVGSRGRSVHAVGLGLAVAVSHTLGIFVLALVIVGAGSVLAPEVIARTTPAIAAVTIVAMGGWMLLGEVRRRRKAARSAPAPFAAADHDHHADHAHVEGDGVGHGERSDHAHGDGDGDGHGEDHGHAHDARGAHIDERAQAHAEQPRAQHDPHEHDHAPHDDRSDAEPPGVHSHGGVRHSHLPPEGATLSWRGLFVLGLAGGLIPSTSALLVLLAAMASGRAAYGLVLVAAFGVGMAAVMTGVGIAMVLARGRLARVPGRSPLGRLAAQAPLLASMFVLGLGVVLTYSAVAGRPVL